MRINRVKHCLKPGVVCGKCGKKIGHSHDEKRKGRGGKAVKVRVLGDPYIWIKHRKSPRRVRCTAPACAFRDSDMTTSEKLGRVYDARDRARQAIEEWDGEEVSELEGVLSEFADEIREVASEYEESADNIEQAFPGGAPTSEECREKADAIGSWADDVESVSFEEMDDPDDGEDPEELKESWAEAQRDAALAAIDDCPV